MPAPKKAKKTRSQPRTVAKPVLLSGGNPQIAKGHGEGPVQACFISLFGERHLGWSAERAESHFRSLWAPNDVWSRFFDESRVALRSELDAKRSTR